MPLHECVGTRSLSSFNTFESVLGFIKGKVYKTSPTTRIHLSNDIIQNLILPTRKLVNLLN